MTGLDPLGDGRDVRAALAAYAAGAPAPFDPKPAVHRRIAARRRRRTAALGTTLAVALTAPVAALALTRERPARDRLTQVASAPARTPSALPTAFPTLPPPTRPPDGGAGLPHRTPDGYRTSDPAATTPAAAAPPSATPWDEEPWDEETFPPGLRVRAALDPAAPGAASYATLSVEATDDDGAPLVTAIDWGDGVVDQFGYPMAACAPHGPDDPPDPPRGARLAQTYEHAWRHLSSYEVTVTVLSMRQCAVPEPPREERSATVLVQVGDGPSVSNGPHQPVVADIGAVHDEGTDEQAVRLYADLSDDDGYIHGVTVYWGDGAVTTVTNEEEGPCDDGGGDHYPSSGFILQEEHTYDTDRTYLVRVVALSAGCEGSDQQSADGTAEVRVPAPPP